MNKIPRPDPRETMDGLKDFQCRTVDYVFKRFYQDPPDQQAKRFLIADEVGLGKTLVARGLIAKAIDSLWEEDDPKGGPLRIDIVYICSNAAIARQNINRLNIMDEGGFAFSSRITLLPLQLKELQNNRVNFISFTPGTSFNLRSSTGIVLERLLLYHILKKEWGFGDSVAPKNIFQGYAGADNFRWWIDYFEREKAKEIDSHLEQQFIEKIRERDDLKIKFEKLCKQFPRKRKTQPCWELRQARDHLIGDIREVMAMSCVDALEPDLVILDEFQRFRSILKGEDQMSKLARKLFDFRYRGSDQHAKVLLLSATPYKMYTMNHEDEDHYRDFMDTIKFLLNEDTGKIAKLEEDLKAFRKALFQMHRMDPEKIALIRSRIENTLKQYMVRTERVGASINRNSMLDEPRDFNESIEPADLDDFAMLDKIAQKLGAGDHVEYWKSASYLLNFMDGYVLKKRLKNEIKVGTAYKSIGGELREARSHLLTYKDMLEYNKIDPRNAKLRSLIEKSVNSGGWKMIWIPPSIPYYRVRGKFYQSPGRKITKQLIFSAWQVVPRVIATLCSYEAERRMMESTKDTYNYEKRHKPLLNFAVKDDRLSGMSILTLLYPSISLARDIDPLNIALSISENGELPSGEKILNTAEDLANKLIKKYLGDIRSREGRIDPRWYWAASALIDLRRYGTRVLDWISEQEEVTAWRLMIKGRGDDDTDADARFSQHVDKLAEVIKNQGKELGRPPDDLAQILAKIALSSPAVTAFRSLNRIWKIPTWEQKKQAMTAAARIGLSFRNMFNLPECITLIQDKKTKYYWQQVLDYGFEGNLQSVLDEYFHILKESLGLINTPVKKAVREVADEVHSAVSLRTAFLSFDDLSVDDLTKQIKSESKYLRCHFALRFGDEKGARRDEMVRSSQVRSAFNSPFRPFVLASTSIGQEGLDFHQYCHSIIHWNLPSNPVDFEQREGRIHRYKGHAIRKNISYKFKIASLQEKKWRTADPWEYLFQLAVKENRNNNDLIPFWIYEVAGGAKIERYVPILPLSRDEKKFINIKNEIVLYRMVFGQSRQQELLNFVQNKLLGDVEEEQKKDILNHRIDLTPPIVEAAPK